MSKKQTAITKQPTTDTNNISLLDAEKTVEEGFVSMARVLSSGNKLAPSTLARAFSVLNGWKKLISNDKYKNGILDEARRQIIEVLKKDGTPVPESTKLVLEAGDFEISMHTYRTGTDPKKLQRLLITKGLDPEVYMRPTITYAVDESRLGLALQKRKLTQAEIDSCQYDESWVVQDPKPIGGIHFERPDNDQD